MMDMPTYLAGTVQTGAYRVLREHVRGVLEQYELSPADWSMLGVLAEAPDGIRQVEVARALRVKAPLVTTMARKLKRRGLISSLPSSSDARSKLLVLTEEGEKLMKTIEHRLSRRLAGLLTGLTPAEMQTYHKVLVTIIANGTAP
jgi:MarR family transcriptional regulator, transcriptional regulator for hemolysin